MVGKYHKRLVLIIDNTGACLRRLRQLETRMPLSKVFLIAIFLLILIKQFLSLSQSNPTIASSVEAVATTVVILIFFGGFRGKTYMVKICAYIGIAVGGVFIASNAYLYSEGQQLIYASSVIGVIQIVLGASILYGQQIVVRSDGKISYLMSIIPIGYIALLAFHDQYPIEANISMFIIQLFVVALILFINQNTSKNYRNILTGLIFLISLIFFVYSIIGFLQNANANSLGYLLYAVLVFMVAFKVSPYPIADSQ